MTWAEDALAAYAAEAPNRYAMSDADVIHREENRNCADDLTVYIKLDAIKEHVTAATFTGKTSLITTACASMVGEAIIGMKTAEVLTKTYTWVCELAGMEFSQRRRQAAVFGLLAFRNAIRKAQDENASDDFSDVLH